MKVILKVEGMMCQHCEARVSKAVQESAAVQSITASHKKGTVEVICEGASQVSVMKEAIEKAGYSVKDTAFRKKSVLGLWV